MRYTSKPSTIEAIRWDSLTVTTTELLSFAPDKVRTSGDPIEVELLAGKDGAQGWVPVPEGHWVVRNPGDDTDYWPVDPDYFLKKYDPEMEGVRATAETAAIPGIAQQQIDWQENQNKVSALDFALRCPNVSSAEGVVSAAETFLNFLKGSGPMSDDGPDPIDVLDD